MDKSEYIKISQNSGLPSRCPILQYCKRRAWTIYFLNEYDKNDPHDNYVLKLKKEGDIPDDFEEKAISIQGESPGGSIGNGNGWFHDLCPEVNLFDTMNAFGYFKGTACSSGSYDNENNPKARIDSVRHFSECAEFSHHLFEHKSFKFNLEHRKTTSKPKPCYTYLMLDKASGLYKIGISNTPKIRERTLQGQQPEIDLLAIRKFEKREFALNLETELHLKYQEFRTRGEWFKFSESDIYKIKEILNEK